MTPEEAVAATQQTIERSGGDFMMDPATLARGQELGVQGWTYYYAGRCGVLGPAPADVVAAAMVFFPLPLVRKTWGKVMASLDLDAAVGSYVEGAHDWGRRKLDTAEGLDELVDVAEKLVDRMDVAGLPLFAGWRSLPRPDDAPARVTQLLNVLREHRGGVHSQMVLAAGMTPLEAVVSSKHGLGNAAFFGWPEPYPDPAPLAEWRTKIEAATNERVAAHYSVLDEGELEALVGGCARVKAAVKAAAA